MKQIFTFFVACIPCLFMNVANAQFSQDFENFSTLSSNCWSFVGVSQTTTAGEVINGNASLYSSPATNSNSTREVYTPYLNITTTSFTVSFKYRLSSALSGQSTRRIEVGLADVTGTFTSLSIITIDANMPNPTNVTTFNGIFMLPTAMVRRLVLRFSGSQGNGTARMIVDDLAANAGAYYGPATNCNSAPVAVNNTYNAISNTATYSGASVLTNDSDPNNEALTAALATQSLDGIAVVNSDGTFTFTPNAGFTGSFTSFTYTVTDAGYDRMSSTATVNIYFPQVTSLPLQLLHFSGTASAKTNLTWTVASNETGVFFEVQRSTNGTAFESIAFIFTTDKSGEETYQFTDAAPAQTACYRLKLVNRDGSAFYSPILSFKTISAATIRLLQNPVQNTLRFSVPQSATITGIRIYNLSGVVLQTEKISGQKNNIILSVPLQANLLQGMYVLEVLTNHGSLTTQFIKQ